jgi:Druantia protein DruA
MSQHDSNLIPLTSRERRLRTRVLNLLGEQGFRIGKDLRMRQRKYRKEQVRRLHSVSRKERLAFERPFVQEWLPRLSQYLASGSDIDPARIDPYPVAVEDEGEMAALFRVACLWWSVPVSRGFGRRFRVLVFDRSNGKLFGLLGLTDPVFNLRARDDWLGWDVVQREDRLAHVMDAYVLGAVPPYNQLLGAKFVALLAASDFTRGLFRKRYRRARSVIRKRPFDGRLAMVTTSSALGRSSIYNRLRFEGTEVFKSVGFTEGYGHFHLANGTFQRMREYLASIGEDEVERYKFGNGPNYRIRVVRKALKRLRLPADLLRHGIRRAVYLAPLAKNTPAFLRGEAKRLLWHARPLDTLVSAWRDRWLLPRASRELSYRAFDSQEWQEITGA